MKLLAADNIINKLKVLYRPVLAYLNKPVDLEFDPRLAFALIDYVSRE